MMYSQQNNLIRFSLNINTIRKCISVHVDKDSYGNNFTSLKWNAMK